MLPSERPEGPPIAPDAPLGERWCDWGEEEGEEEEEEDEVRAR